MKFGLALGAQFAPGESFTDGIAWVIEQTRLARDLGFDAVLTGDHRLADPYQYSSPLPLLARLAPESGDMALVAVLLMSLHHPVDVAEDGATVDAISGGRLVCAAGMGYRDIEYAAFGLDRKDRLGRFIEALDILEILWRQDKAEYAGKHYSLPPTPVCTRPTRPGGPPIWIAANADGAVRRAGERGYPWVINPHGANDTLQRQRALYSESLRLAGRRPPLDVPIIRETVIDTDAAAAWETASRFLGAKFQVYARWGKEGALPGKESLQVPFEELARDRFLIGAPETCAEQVRRLEATVGANLVFFHTHWPGMPREQARRSIRLLGEKVLPALRRTQSS